MLKLHPLLQQTNQFYLELSYKKIDIITGYKKRKNESTTTKAFAKYALTTVELSPIENLLRIKPYQDLPPPPFRLSSLCIKLKILF
jgi:hypothetical protein